MIKVLITLQPEADSGKDGLCLAAGIACFAKVDVHVIHIITGGVFWSCYKYAQFGSGLKKKKKMVSLICCNDGVLPALCHFPYPCSEITCN